MVGFSRSRIEVAAIRSDLAGIGVSLGWIRIERALRRKYDPDQPREPAGQPGGGRWSSGDSSAPGSPTDRNEPETTGSIGGDGTASTTQEEGVTPDGSRILTIRIRSNPQAEWDEQHTVTSPDGERTIIEMSGRTQTVRDGESGAILARSTLTDRGVVPEAFVQTALRLPRGAADALFARTTEALGTLFTYLSAKIDYGKVIWSGPASAYDVSDGVAAEPIWVGAVSQSELDSVCPRNGEVQAIADDIAAQVRASGNYLSPQDFGNKVHKLIAAEVNSQKDPSFRAEESYEPIPQKFGYVGAPYSIRVDVLEESIPQTVCLYDHKTGQEGLRPGRVAQIVAIVRRNFPSARRVFIIEVRPRR